MRASATGTILAPAGDGASADTAQSVGALPAGAPVSLAYERAGTYTGRVERAGCRA